MSIEEITYINDFEYQEKMIKLKECELLIEKRKIETFNKELALQKLEIRIRIKKK